MLQASGKTALYHMLNYRTADRHGNLRSSVPIKYVYGSLPAEYRSQVDKANYVIYSFNTPIAWYNGALWIVPNVFYQNRHIRNHQENLRSLLDPSDPSDPTSDKWIVRPAISRPQTADPLFDHDTPHNDTCLACFYASV